MPAEPKYIFTNGVLTRNPKYIATGSENNIPVARPANPVEASQLPLAYVSSITDIENAQEVIGQPVQMPASTTNALEEIQSGKYDYLEQDTAIDNIGGLFNKYDIPMGLLSKLNQLGNYDLLDFIIDDSGSMLDDSNVKTIEASEWMKPVIQARLRRQPHATDPMRRIEEAEDRLHIMIDMLASLPILSIQIRFLNNTNVLRFNRTEKTPTQFSESAHREIRNQFQQLNLGGTPVKKALETGFKLPGNVMHYLFNDGVPNEGGSVIAQLIKNRLNHEQHPVTLISCSNNQRDTEWMKQVDGNALYVAEVDDYRDEEFEVLKKQGVALPYTKGMWLVCNLVAAICPHDLDALDENLPLTKYTLDALLGRVHSPYEYQYYFQNNPNAYLYIDKYQEFLTRLMPAKFIVSEVEQRNRETINGYQNGKRPDIPLANIAPELEPITQQSMQVVNEHNIEVNNPAVSPTSGHYHGFFPTAAPAYQPPPAYTVSSNSKMGLG